MKKPIYRKMKEAHDRLRWSGLTATLELAQQCEMIVENNAKLIRTILKVARKVKERCDFLVEDKNETLFNVDDETLIQIRDFQQVTHELMCHFCECLDIQSNLILMNKNSLIALNKAEKALIYRHVHVDVVRAFQKLNEIDKHIRENDILFSVGM